MAKNSNQTSKYSNTTVTNCTVLTIGVHIQLGKGVEGEHKAILGGGKADIPLQWRHRNLFSLITVHATLYSKRLSALYVCVRACVCCVCVRCVLHALCVCMCVCMCVCVCVCMCMCVCMYVCMYVCVCVCVCVCTH